VLRSKIEKQFFPSLWDNKCLIDWDLKSLQFALPLAIVKMHSSCQNIYFSLSLMLFAYTLSALNLQGVIYGVVLSDFYCCLAALLCYFLRALNTLRKKIIQMLNCIIINFKRKSLVRCFKAFLIEMTSCFCVHQNIKLFIYVIKEIYTATVPFMLDYDDRDKIERKTIHERGMRFEMLLQKISFTKSKK
jgi:uncharacterized YccA/Bax inhibitor family protein